MFFVVVPTCVSSHRGSPAPLCLFSLSVKAEPCLMCIASAWLLYAHCLALAWHHSFEWWREPLQFSPLFPGGGEERASSCVCLLAKWNHHTITQCPSPLGEAKSLPLARALLAQLTFFVWENNLFIFFSFPLLSSRSPVSTFSMLKMVIY